MSFLAAAVFFGGVRRVETGASPPAPGRVVETGTHAHLMARGGLYARLAALQFGSGAA